MAQKQEIDRILQFLEYTPPHPEAYQENHQHKDLDTAIVSSIKLLCFLELCNIKNVWNISTGGERLETETGVYFVPKSIAKLYNDLKEFLIADNLANYNSAKDIFIKSSAQWSLSRTSSTKKVYGKVNSFLKNENSNQTIYSNSLINFELLSNQQKLQQIIEKFFEAILNLKVSNITKSLSRYFFNQNQNASQNLAGMEEAPISKIEHQLDYFIHLLIFLEACNLSNRWDTKQVSLKTTTGTYQVPREIESLYLKTFKLIISLKENKKKEGRKETALMEREVRQLIKEKIKPSYRLGYRTNQIYEFIHYSIFIPPLNGIKQTESVTYSYVPGYALSSDKIFYNNLMIINILCGDKKQDDDVQKMHYVNIFEFYKTDLSGQAKQKLDSSKLTPTFGVELFNLPFEKIKEVLESINNSGLTVEKLHTVSITPGLREPVYHHYYAPLYKASPTPSCINHFKNFLKLYIKNKNSFYSSTLEERKQKVAINLLNDIQRILNDWFCCLLEAFSQKNETHAKQFYNNLYECTILAVKANIAAVENFYQAQSIQKNLGSFHNESILFLKNLVLEGKKLGLELDTEFEEIPIWIETKDFLSYKLSEFESFLLKYIKEKSSLNEKGEQRKREIAQNLLSKIKKSKSLFFQNKNFQFFIQIFIQNLIQEILTIKTEIANLKSRKLKTACLSILSTLNSIKFSVLSLLEKTSSSTKGVLGTNTFGEGGFSPDQIQFLENNPYIPPLYKQ